jgi:hypothetical protein
MNLKQSARYNRRKLVRRINLAYARFASWIPERFPDFMCIGAPRAATTWLHQALALHPDVFLPKRKEIHFYDEAAADEVESGGDLRWHDSFTFDVGNPAHLRWYWRQFRDAGERIAGDFTPLYSTLSAERVRLIHQQIPALRIIYILRNPVERAWSGLRKSVWYQKGSSFLETKSTEWALEQVMHPTVLLRGNYPRAIENWESAFPRSQMMYLFHDDIDAEPAAALECVQAFLDIPAVLPTGAAADGERVNSAPAQSMPRVVRDRLNEYYRDQVALLERRFGRNLSHWLS